MNNYKEISVCEVCDASQLKPVLNLGLHPLCDDLVPVGGPEVCSEYPIDISYCTQCNTAHQSYQVEKKLLFPPTYHYRARFTSDVLDGMSELVDACEAQLGSLHEKKVLDVGCNDGSLLGFFKKKGAITIGIEPTGAIKDASSGGHSLYNDFFDETSAAKVLKDHGSPDIISFTNVFAHIEDLNGLIESLRGLISPTTLLVVENHYLGAVLKKGQFDTFYHEHPRTYSLGSFGKIAEKLGLSVISTEFPARYGGNVRVFMGSNSPSSATTNNNVTEILKEESSFFSEIKKMQNNVELWKESKSREIKSLVEIHGPLKAKAFPGRAAILIKLLGLDESSIECVYERPGSMKIGHYLPGTRIPIKSDDELFALPDSPPVIINLAWHISVEINDFLRKQGFCGEIIDIYNPELIEDN
jgi:SAM-dependent methyltransferase